MTRYENIIAMTLEQMADEIVENEYTFEYCKSDCTAQTGRCEHPTECCIKWLEEKYDSQQLKKED